MPKYEVSSLALHDLDSISFYIAQDSLAAAETWLEDSYETFTMLSRFPQIGRGRPEIRRGVRSLARGNYVIFYRVTKKKQVVILRIFEGHRDIHQADV